MRETSLCVKIYGVGRLLLFGEWASLCRLSCVTVIVITAFFISTASGQQPTTGNINAEKLSLAPSNNSSQTPTDTSTPRQTLKLGVLAHLGKEQAVKLWQPTADYLTNQIPSYQFVLVPLDFTEIYIAVEKGEVDFIIANSGIYVEMEYLYGANRIATLISLRNGQPYTVFGGVIIARADRTDIKDMTSLKGKSFYAIDETSLGGWQLAWLELKRVGVDPYSDFKELKFIGNHDQVVIAVRDGKADSGTVRSDTLERMMDSGAINQKDIKVLNLKPQTLEFPLLYSTELVPEWPFAVAKHVPDKIAVDVAVALLKMPKDSPAAKASKGEGWTIPLNYQPVHDVFKELRVRPYQNFGKVTLREVLWEYRYWLVVAVICIMGLVLIALNFRRLNHKLGKFSAQLKEEVEERKLAEESMRALQARFAGILDIAQDAIISVDAHQRIILFNQGAEKIFGYTADEAIGQSLEMLLPVHFTTPHHQQGIEETFVEFLYTSSRLGEHREIFGCRKDGCQFPAETSISKLTLMGEEVYTAILRDITEQKMAEEKLLTAKNAAEAANHAKSEFLASMSHEIRTPMNGIIGMTGLLLDSHLTKDQRDSAMSVQFCGESLLTIINDILDFSKIEAGKLDVEPIPFDLRFAVEEVADLLSTRTQGKDVDLIVRYEPSTPRYLIGDAGRIRQILTNLTGNAIKFTEHGHVFINVETVKRNDLSTVIRFSVQDTGIGIPEDKLEHVFEKFTQADSSTTRKYGGTGLGLAICKNLTELMGGEIGLTSSIGKGSNFWFTLPLKLSTEVPSAPTPSANLTGLRAIIVDDNEINRRVLQEQIGSWGIRNEGFASGEEALVALRKAKADGDSYQIALLDHCMPGMTGEMLGRIIKSDPDLKDTVLVMLTSVSFLNQARLMKEIGFAAHLVKPVRHSHLMDVIGEVWHNYLNSINPNANVSNISSATATDLTNTPFCPTNVLFTARVLVAEDNIVNQKLAQRVLEKMGCRVDLAANGREAVEMVALLPYDVVFMDCQMPEMDGFEATKRIRSLENGSLPIIAMTAHAMQGDRERCLNAGMDDYIPKPIKPVAIQKVLSQWLSPQLTNATEELITPTLIVYGNDEAGSHNR